MVKCRVDSFSTGTAEWVRDVLTYRSRFSPSTSSTTHMLTTTSGPRAVQGTSDVTYRSRFSPITNADRKQALKQKPSSVSFNHLNGHNEAMKVVRIAAGSSINMRNNLVFANMLQRLSVFPEPFIGVLQQQMRICDFFYFAPLLMRCGRHFLIFACT